MKSPIPFLPALVAGMSCALCGACGSDERDYDAHGVFEATEVVVSAQTQGELLMFDRTEGDTVAHGDIVVQVDTVQLSLQRRQLLASLDAVGSRHYNVARQVAAIRQQIATQHSERTRFARLVAEHAANQKQVDDIDAQIALLEKQLAAQTETLENTNSGLQAEAQGIEAQLAALDDQLRRSAVRSPIKGTLLAKYAERGELATPGKPLFKVADMEHLYLRAYVTAPQLTQLKLGQQVRVFADEGSEGRKEYQGHIAWIADEAEFTPKTIQTRDERSNLVYAVKIAVRNDGLIKLGMYGSCEFQ
ncbi:MAG: HlyD family secretion protein [Alloprevotella sp.]